jgi:zinc D-Ala-D-Ala carboxypeptidase
MTWASPNFSLDELTFSETATRKGIDNTPSDDVLDNLYKTAMEMENVRELLNNNPILISSGYRCLELNTLLGSKPTSAHTRGLACDFTCPKFGDPNDIVDAIFRSDIFYDQIILEVDKWVHIAFPANGESARKKALIINKKGTMIYLQ